MFILIGDTHLGVKKGNDVYIQVFNNLIDDVCNTAQKSNIKNIIILGDFFDTRKSLSLKVINNALSAMDKLISVFDKVFLIVGNHDTYLKTQLDPTSLDIFKEYKSVLVIKEPIEVDNILMVPWLFDKDVLNSTDAQVCIGHFDINGIEMNSSGFTPLFCKLEQSDFKQFNKVFSGHYHIPSLTGNIQYLGAPYQTTFNEINQILGYYVFNSESLKLDFIEFAEYPKHIIIEDTYEYTKDEIEGNNVKLIFTNDYGVERNTQIIRNIQVYNPNNLSIVYHNVSNTMADGDDMDVELMSKIDILHDYHKKSELPDGISQVILKKLTNKVYKETIGE